MTHYVHTTRSTKRSRTLGDKLVNITAGVGWTIFAIFTLLVGLMSVGIVRI